MIRPERLLANLDAFAQVGATQKGGVDRPALSAADRDARALLTARAQRRGFAVLTDAAANLFVRREGTEPGLPAVLIGSHLDSQPSGGRFDGALGTLAAFECLEALEDAAVATRHPVEAVAWTNEEGSRFPRGTMGAVVVAGKAAVTDWSAVRDAHGVGFLDELAATLAALPAAAPRPAAVPHAYIELHIEQGPVLEAEAVPIGAVTGVQGTRWLEVTVSGAAAHAGTTPPAYRRDALAAAVHIVDRMEAFMAADTQARVTCGRFEAQPGSVNVIAGRVTFTLDLRHPEAESLDAMERRLHELAGAQERVSIRVERLLDLPACRFEEAIVRRIEGAADRLALPHRPILSGAFHDAVHLAHLCPTGMIFVPCRDGISHNEAEYVSPEHAVAGARVLFEVMRRLAG